MRILDLLNHIGTCVRLSQFLLLRWASRNSFFNHDKVWREDAFDSVGLKEICFHDLGVICLFSFIILDFDGNLASLFLTIYAWPPKSWVFKKSYLRYMGVWSVWTKLLSM